MYRDFTVEILKFSFYAEIFSPVLVKLFQNSRMGQKCQEISVKAKSENVRKYSGTCPVNSGKLNFR